VADEVILQERIAAVSNGQLFAAEKEQFAEK
jgi:hypothetical protein